MPAMTFTRTIPGTLTEGTDTTDAPTTSTIEGDGIVVRGKPQRYQALSLNLSTMPTVLFTPDTYPLEAFTDEFVLPGDVTTLNGVAMTVKDVDPIAPDGYVIAARLILSAGGE